MTNHTMTPLPADADCTALMLATINECIAEINSSMPYFRDRFDIISDYDDYIPAAARILERTLDRFLAHIDATPRDALLALLDDDYFIYDLLTIDFASSLRDLINLDFAN